MKKKLLLSSIAGLGFLFPLYPAEKFVNDQDFSIPENWQYKKLMGRDYWPVMGFYQLTKDPAKVTKRNGKRAAAFAHTWLEYGFPMKETVREKYKKLGFEFHPKKYPAFTDTAWVSYSGIGITAKRDPHRKDIFNPILNKLPEFELATEKKKPFLINSETLFRGAVGRILFVTGENYNATDAQKKDFEKWRKAHPGFLGFFSLVEWDNNCYILDRHFYKNWWKLALRNKIVKAEEEEKYLKEFKKRWPEPKNRREWVEKRLRPYFQRAVDASFGDPALAIPISGSGNINHLAAYWGSKLICLETSRHNTRWQGQMMFTRGAARQFNIPWGWYVAGFLSGYSSTGKRVTDSSPSRYPGGISLSAIRRGFYMTWLSGANIMQSEIALWTNFDQVLKGAPFQITKAGEEYKKMYDFIQKHPDRGVPYTPVALLVNYDRGSNRLGGKPFWKFPFTHADSMLDAFCYYILDRGFNDGTLGRKGLEYVMGHSPYGDIFDAITPDFKDQSSFKKILPSYKAAVLLGEYPDNPALSKILTQFVRNGGTLLINVKHLSKSFPASLCGIALTGKKVSSGDFTVEKVQIKNAAVVERDEQGNPILTIASLGKGKILTSLQHYMTNYQKAKPFRRNQPLIDKVLRRFAAETLPVKVEGDIQYGINKNQKGWRIYLINNKGVIKFTDKEEQHDLKHIKTVKISFPKIKVKKITELFSGKKLELEKGLLTLQIMPGDIKILEICDR